MNEEEAKEMYEELKRNKKIIKNIDTDFFFKFAETVLNLLEKKDEEIKEYRKVGLRTKREQEQIKKSLKGIIAKKDKIIDLMAEDIDIELSSSRLGTILNKNVKPLESYKKDIKQYFERKVEEDKQC